MSESRDLDALIQRAATDTAFRARLIADPAGTIAAEGYEVPQETLSKMENIDQAAAEQALAALADSSGDRRAAG